LIFLENGKAVIRQVFAFILFCFPEQKKKTIIGAKKILNSFLLTGHVKKLNTLKARQWRFFAGTENSTDS
jgi:hypothetical protein